MYKITVQQHTTFRPKPLFKDVRHWAKLALCPFKAAGWLAIDLVDRAIIQELNLQFRQKDAPTNVLSFPLYIPVAQKCPFLGDLIICPEIVWQEALAQEKTYENHFAHLVIHGVLHLLGHDHILPEEAQIMESIEIQLLTELNIDNPYE